METIKKGKNIKKRQWKENRLLKRDIEKNRYWKERILKEADIKKKCY